MLGQEFLVLETVGVWIGKEVLFMIYS